MHSHKSIPNITNPGARGGFTLVELLVVIAIIGILLGAILVAGTTLIGPAIVEQLDTTIVVEPGDRVTVDALGNLMIEVGGP